METDSQQPAVNEDIHHLLSSCEDNVLLIQALVEQQRTLCNILGDGPQPLASENSDKAVLPLGVISRIHTLNQGLTSIRMSFTNEVERMRTILGESG